MSEEQQPSLDDIRAEVDTHLGGYYRDLAAEFGDAVY